MVAGVRRSRGGAQSEVAAVRGGCDDAGSSVGGGCAEVEVWFTSPISLKGNACTQKECMNTCLSNLQHMHAGGYDHNPLSPHE